MQTQWKTVIESLGAYLPARSVTTADVISGCAKRVRLPVQRLTGIESRRWASDEEFSIDIARKSIEDCLRCSRKTADEVDLLICCNISRYDAADQIAYEPTTAIKLQREFGMDAALVFDVTNACAGMFTGVYLADALIRAGLVRCGLVVSGEYITDVVRTAQREIRKVIDPQLASLTVGDAGAAVLLERGPVDGPGFDAIDMFTFSKYSGNCIAKPSDEEHGGLCMKVDPLEAARIGTHPGLVRHVQGVLESLGRPLSSFDHVIPHQTSRTTMQEILRELKRLLHVDLRDATVDNIAERGNTASNSHFVALKDHILTERIRSGDDIVFFVTGSGITIGAAAYGLDDLPERVRAAADPDRPCPNATDRVANKFAPQGRLYRRPPGSGGVGIEAIGTTLASSSSTPADSTDLMTRAAKKCLEHSRYSRSQMDMLLGVGVYRSGFVIEPAAAALAARDIKMNSEPATVDSPTTLAFDVLNGSLGYLTGCLLAQTTIGLGKIERVMLVAGEVEGNSGQADAQPRGVVEAGSAMILETVPEPDAGFISFYFRNFPEYMEEFSSDLNLDGAHSQLVVKKSAALEDHYLSCIQASVQGFLDQEDLEISVFRQVIAPQVSPDFLNRVAEILNVPAERLVDVTSREGDLFTSSIPFALTELIDSNQISPGDQLLMISATSGIQVACARYVV